MTQIERDRATNEGRALGHIFVAAEDFIAGRLCGGLISLSLAEVHARHVSDEAHGGLHRKLGAIWRRAERLADELEWFARCRGWPGTEGA